ncbi:MAG: methylenetetrahydrofolate reductase [NAD(P)H] [bacterium]|jgi:methylenetetrahydrofolate reductase (NADPH)|nr:methylenetetrahydrofolate reductase [NAD(P)H] [Planctomycetota bacterium]HIL51088.1 methylenetetrahydrofolate reductase [NAD(P)H] [Planctomycetota bacterium]
MYGTGEPVFSFEFFPPKTDEGAKNLMKTVAALKGKLSPHFVSVTYGAGGSTRDRTLEVVANIQNDLSITALAHLTCVASSRGDLREAMRRMITENVENILALRGDIPSGEGEFVPPEDGFRHASELIDYLANNYFVDIGAACYPESHPESDSAESDMQWTKSKYDLGANFLITQLFFDNSHYFDFVERARAAGVKAPIVPGIMPITNVAQIERFTKMCGATIPEELQERLARIADDPAAVMATGIELAIDQSRELLDKGAPGLHFYTLNKCDATRSVLAALR